jgi:hypothetical protein
LRGELDNKKSGSGLLSRDGQMFFRSKKSLFDFAPEGYLTSSGWPLELDNKKSEPIIRNRQVNKKSLPVFLLTGEK